MKFRHLLGAIALAVAGTASAQSLDLSRYSLSSSYAIDALGGLGLEASAVTYARDRQSLFIVPDEGLGVVELSLTGSVLGSMRFDNYPANSTSDGNDVEGLAYLGGGVLVAAEERFQDAYRFSFVNGGTVDIAAAPWVAIDGTTGNIGNVGIEGLAYDKRDGSFVAVKQDNPQRLFAGAMTFATGSGGTSSMVKLFEGVSLFGLNSLSDVSTLAEVDALAGTAVADHLLVLSLDSRRLVEIDRSGTIYSSLDLSGLTGQAIEGVTIDERGVIYLVAEQGAGSATSQLLVLTAVPEPGSLALSLAGLAVLGVVARRRRA